MKLGRPLYRGKPVLYSIHDYRDLDRIARFQCAILIEPISEVEMPLLILLMWWNQVGVEYPDARLDIKLILRKHRNIFVRNIDKCSVAFVGPARQLRYKFDGSALIHT